MLDIGWSEMAIVMVVALLVIGPKDLPRVARSIGKWTAKARSMAREFQRSLDDMAREAELTEIKSELDKVRHKDIGQTIRDTVDPKGELDRAFELAPDRPERRVTPGPAAVERARAEEKRELEGPAADAQGGEQATASVSPEAPAAEPRTVAAAAGPTPPSATGEPAIADPDAARKS
ncbi:Sec-independent protein translocase protein TatB [Geminicoccaceae bacterium 1502E]|nr:Sec-independent protein translocase protein TatB [Geminicoccaceae bacterium 1502E]